jgi:NADP-dependent 3-hydroxy acid dehydrogenase YdfG/acyl carrier protein
VAPAAAVTSVTSVTSVASAATPGGRWLVVTSGGVDDAVQAWAVRALAAAGHEVVTLTATPTVDRGVLRARLAEVVAAGPIAGVVSLVGMDETPNPGAGVVAAGLAVTLVLVQALGDAGIEAPLWCLTQGAAGAPQQAQIWGLGRVVGLEHPARWGGLIDLPATLDDVAAARLTTALTEAGGEDQIALRPDGIHLRRLVHAPPSSPPGPAERWSTRGTALITGGTGALGGHVARWLVGSGAEHVILVSRRGPDAPGAAELATELEARGARVTVAAADVADRGALDGLLAAVPPGQPLRTIVHCAGASRGGELAGLEVADLVEASAAKARGAQHLHDLAEHHALDLDAFVLFSSGAAVWGGGAQGAYAAANAFVDGLAEQRRAQGRPATAVAWGPWAGGGMAEGGTGDQLRRWGVHEMAPELALRALQQALDEGATNLAVADVDWQRFAPSFAAARRRPLIEDLPEAARALDLDPDLDDDGDDRDGSPRPANGRGAELEQRLAGLDAADRRAALVELVRDEVAAVLGHAGPGAVDPDRTFKDLGFDSVTAVELRNRLQALTGLRLPATLVFDHPNPGALGVELAVRLAPEPRSVGREALRHLARVEAALDRAPDGDDEALAQVRIGVRRLLARLADGNGAGGSRPADRGIEDQLLEADDDELLAFIDRELS